MGGNGPPCFIASSRRIFDTRTATTITNTMMARISNPTTMKPNAPLPPLPPVWMCKRWENCVAMWSLPVHTPG